MLPSKDCYVSEDWGLEPWKPAKKAKKKTWTERYTDQYNDSINGLIKALQETETEYRSVKATRLG